RHAARVADQVQEAEVRAQDAGERDGADGALRRGHDDRAAAHGSDRRVDGERLAPVLQVLPGWRPGPPPPHAACALEFPLKANVAVRIERPDRPLDVGPDRGPVLARLHAFAARAVLVVDPARPRDVGELADPFDRRVAAQDHVEDGRTAPADPDHECDRRLRCVAGVVVLHGEALRSASATRVPRSMRSPATTRRYTSSVRLTTEGHAYDSARARAARAISSDPGAGATARGSPAATSSGFGETRKPSRPCRT